MSRKAVLLSNPIKTLRGLAQNQDVTLELSNNTVTVTSNQNRSTPGIKLAGGLRIPKGELYEFIVKGRTIDNATAFLWGDKVRDKTTRITAITAESTTYLTGTTSTLSVVIGGFSVDTDVRLGVLFEDPLIGEQIEIQGFAVIQRLGTQLGDFVLYDMPNNLVVGSRNTHGEWKNVAAFVKRS